MQLFLYIYSPYLLLVLSVLILIQRMLDIQP